MTKPPHPTTLCFALGALFLLAGSLAIAKHSQACTIKPYPDLFSTTSTEAATPPAAPKSTKVTVRRSKYAGPGTGDCGGVGSIQLDFELAGAAWPETMGIWLRVVSGTLPRLLNLPGGPMKVDAGSLGFAGSDDPAQPIDVTLQATTVDATGTESLPITIHVVSAGSVPDGGCSFSPHAKATPGFMLFLLGFLLLARAKSSSTHPGWHPGR